MKWVRRILLTIVVLVVIVLVVVTFFLGAVVKKSVETVGPKVVGVPITLEKARISVLLGQAKLSQLVVGNPEGFKTPSAFALGELKIDLDVASLLSDRIVIREILVDAPEITFEGSLKGSNLGALRKQLESPGDAQSETPLPEEPAAKSAGAQKKVQIDRFVLSNAKVNLSSGLMQGKAVTIPLPTIELTDIGKGKEGASVSDVVREVLSAVSDAVTQAVLSSGKVLGKSVELGKDAAMKGLDVAGSAADMGLDAAGKAADVGGEAAGAAVDAAGAAAKKTGEALTDGAGKLVGGVGGLLRKKKDEPVAESENK